MATLLHRLGLAAVRRRLIVVIAWALVLLAAGAGALALNGKTVTTFNVPGQESSTALDLLTDRFDRPDGASAQVVLQAPGDEMITSPQRAQVLAGLVADLDALPGVVAASNPLDPAAPTISPDQRAAYSTLTYEDTAADITQAQRDALGDVLDDARDAGLTAEVTGEASAEPVHVGGPAEVIGVLVALAVLAITFGSLVTAGMNLLTAVVGVGVGLLGIVMVSGLTELQSTTPILAAMLGLAVGIDYALFIITRHRQELLDGRPVPEAIAMAVGTAGSAVLVAGGTVVIALAALTVAGIPFLTQMGLAAAATVIIAVLIALTLVPALLSYLGQRVLPRRLRAEARLTAAGAPGSVEPDRRSGYDRWGSVVTRFRWPAVVVAALALVVVAIPAASMRTSLVISPPDGSTQARAEKVLADRFGPGVSGPLLVLVDGEGAPARAGDIAERAGGLDDVALVTPPQPSADGGAALVTVIPASAPDSAATEELVTALRGEIADTDPDSAARAYVTGSTAVSVDVADSLDTALPTYLLLVVGLALVLLVLLFRSILVPVVGVVGFLLTIGAALGATTAVFQWGWLSGVVRPDSTGPLLSLAPIIIVGVLFGLAMDYQIFLVSRMHEAYAKGASAQSAITSGFHRAAPVVVAAAAIMFSVFAGFVPTGDAQVKPFAFGLAVGIVFDAFVVRLVFVPAVMSLLGRAAWWLPSWLRWIPQLDAEGAALEDDHDGAGARRDHRDPRDGGDGGDAGGDDDDGRGQKVLAGEGAPGR